MKRLREADYVVVDVETTGVLANRTDRIIEIAILRLDADGQIADRYVSLVNPERDLGPTDIHGICARDVLHAPRFSEIVGDVVSFMANAVIVAHNVRFDAGFLRSECKRAGCDLPDFPTLCTLYLASRLVSSLASRQLSECCKYFGIDIANCHSAESDAAACAQLLIHCMALASDCGYEHLSELGCHGTFAEHWPQLPRSGKSHCRLAAQRLKAADSHYLARLVTRLIASKSPDVSDDMTAYLALLDKALEDRIVTEQESDALFIIATEWGLTGEQVCAAHYTYLGELARAAMLDGTVTDSEHRDLIEVTRLLGFDEKTLNTVLNEARAEPVRSERCDDAREDLTGKSVCFTGTLRCKFNGEPISRDMAHQLAADAGMTIAENVTKSLDILVVADPHSMSGKAKKARQYGTRIMADMAFWRALGISVD
jgi:DNA polymerase-3 subunit epsilon